MVRVAVTDLEYRKAETLFVRAADEGCDCVRAPAEEGALAEAIRVGKMRHAIIGVERYHGPLYQALSAGGIIARFGVGHDGVDKAQATARGLLCTNTPGALDDSVAEHTINLLFAAARHTVAQAARLRAGDWAPQMGSELKGKTLAVIGCGAIGRRVGQMAARGLGMKVAGCEVADLDVERLCAECGFASVVRDFGEAVDGADFVSLHIPSLPQTRHFLNGERLRRLPARCWVVNTARGAVVDEAALYDALAGGRLAGAALDVFEQEPYEPAAPGKDLRALANVIMTPHISSSTREACDRMASRALRNILLAEAGKHADMDLLNPEVLAKLGQQS
ncbi:MAG TPA: NAD(P)-dependent oxidoreductase [Candidatus Paceibacterota bacterium]|nr:NAD(P)-dependent oxidoreductase [Verrucomicrobiota bacterium]HSA11069.1 NAD(P)-dependent oxidoreductase [Candidatus Paceibacterota bacterium]